MAATIAPMYFPYWTGKGLLTPMNVGFTAKKQKEVLQNPGHRLHLVVQNWDTQH